MTKPTTEKTKQTRRKQHLVIEMQTDGINHFPSWSPVDEAPPNFATVADAKAWLNKMGEEGVTYRVVDVKLTATIRVEKIVKRKMVEG